MQFTKSTIVLFVAVLISCISCSTKNDNHPLIGQVRSSLEEDDRAVVMAFWSTECPLCLNYTKNISELSDKYEEKGINFTLVFSGKDFPEDEVKSYLAEYGIVAPYIIDTGYVLAKYYEATVTPQVVVLNKEYKKIYSGKIDNWIVSLGQKRQVVTEFYLQNVLSSIEQNETPKIADTEPIGCILE